MVSWLRAVAALLEDLSFIPSTHLVAYKASVTPVPGVLMFSTGH